MNEIGGFFELELNSYSEFHANAIKLNTGRNCLEYILRANCFDKIYIPYFICDVVLEPIKKCKIEFEFYKIDSDFNPIIDFKSIKNNDAFLFVNYFGLKQNSVINLSKLVNNLIVDNTQAFFAEPLKAVHTFYSPRKFLGVADGGYLYSETIFNAELERDYSHERMSHLIRRIDEGAQSSYNEFKINSKKLVNQDILEMSDLTSKLLCSIDYELVKISRERNFSYMHKHLRDLNELNINTEYLNGPMVYPFMIQNERVRSNLIKNKIFIAQYWPNVLKWCDNESVEYNMTKFILALPIDQRYSINDMDFILKILEKE